MRARRRPTLVDMGKGRLKLFQLPDRRQSRTKWLVVSSCDEGLRDIWSGQCQGQSDPSRPPTAIWVLLVLLWSQIRACGTYCGIYLTFPPEAQPTSKERTPYHIFSSSRWLESITSFDFLTICNPYFQFKISRLTNFPWYSCPTSTYEGGDVLKWIRPENRVISPKIFN